MADWNILKLAGYSIQSEDDILDALPKFLQDPSVDRLKFTVSVIADKSEPWIIRAEACRFIRDIESGGWGSLGICTAVSDILIDETEHLTLKQWAAFLIDRCQDSRLIAVQVYRYVSKSDEVGRNMLESLGESDLISKIIRTELEKVLMADVEVDVRQKIEMLLSNQECF